MKLRAGIPPWVRGRSAMLSRNQLRGVVTCDVAVIGAGVTGALVAYELLRAGRRVVMLDKRTAGQGSTAASTGLLLIQPDTSIAEITRRHGRKTAQRVFQLGRDAVRDLGRLSRRLGAGCEWRSRRTLYVASHPNDVAFVRAEVQRTKSIGFAAQFLSSTDLRRQYQVDRAGAIHAAGAAEINPYAFNIALLETCARDERFRLHQNTYVTRLTENAGGVRLLAENGAEIRARHAIVAAGYESGQFGKSRLVRLHSTYVIASKPFPPAALEPLRCLMWDTDRPYFYLRTTRDHRIVFGGADDPFANASRRDRRLSMKTRQLQMQFAMLFPSLAFEPEYAWTGTFADTTDGLPCIGAMKRDSHVLFALGYGGNGITFSQIAAKILRDVCLGHRNADAALFAFDRSRR